LLASATPISTPSALRPTMKNVTPAILRAAAPPWEDVLMFAKVRSGLERRAGHVIFGSRKWVEGQITDLAADQKEARILEIGSGRQDMGEDAFSFHHLFGADCEFIKSDVNPEHGHMVVDVTSMDFVDEWDVILCVSVLEHVPDVPAAVGRIYQALKPGGCAVIVAPMCFPYHDEPHDYWRFTVHGVRHLLQDFVPLKLTSRGPRRLPFTMLALAYKPDGPASPVPSATG
jgi:SAM-dependent methyltransferase